MECVRSIWLHAANDQSHGRNHDCGRATTLCTRGDRDHLVRDRSIAARSRCAGWSERQPAITARRPSPVRTALPPEMERAAGRGRRVAPPPSFFLAGERIPNWRGDPSRDRGLSLIPNRHTCLRRRWSDHVPDGHGRHGDARVVGSPSRDAPWAVDPFARVEPDARDASISRDDLALSQKPRRGPPCSCSTPSAGYALGAGPQRSRLSPRAGVQPCTSARGAASNNSMPVVSAWSRPEHPRLSRGRIKVQKKDFEASRQTLIPNPYSYIRSLARSVSGSGSELCATPRAS